MLCITKSLVLKPTVLSLCFVLLSACSSGGGKNKNNPPPTDTSPDAVTFNLPSGADLNKVALNSTVISNPVAISGINSATAISIVGGTYAVGAGEFTDKPSTINNGDQLKVKLVTGTKAGESTSATLTLGGVIAKFTVKTQPDDHKRELTVLFPPPNFMTEGADVLVRGKVIDLDGTLTEDGVLVVDGKPIKLTLNTNKTEGTWEARAALIAAAQGNFLVESQDQLTGPTLKQSISYKQVKNIEKEYFPNNELPMAYPLKVDVGIFDNKLTAFIAESDPQKPAIYGVNLSSGERSIIADNSNIQDETLKFKSCAGVDYIGNNRLIVIDGYRAIFEINIANNNRTLLGATTTGGSSFVSEPAAALLQQTDGKEQIIMADAKRVYSIELSNPQQKKLISSTYDDEAIPNADNPFSTLWGIMDYGQQYLVADARNIFSVNKVDGVRTNITNSPSGVKSYEEIVKSGLNDDIYYLSALPDSIVKKIRIKPFFEEPLAQKADGKPNGILELHGMATYPGLGYMLLSDYLHRALFAMDYVTGERVVITKSYTPPVTE